MKTLAQQLHALTVDNLPTPKPGAAMLHRVSLIPPGHCRNCWSFGRAIQLAPICTRCGIHTPEKTVAALLQKHRDENK